MSDNHIIKGDTDGKWELPAGLLTKEHLAKSQAMQDDLAQRVNSPFASKSTKDLEMFRAGILIKELEPLMQAGVISAIDREYLAESYASIGEYAKASQATANDANKERWEAIWNAVFLDDAEKCNCPDAQHDGGRTNNQGVEENVFSLKHLKVMPVIKCSICGHRNVAQLPSRISKERSHRQLSIAAVSGMKPEDAKATLTDMGHTSKLIVK